jgi:acyl carrier protein
MQVNQERFLEVLENLLKNKKQNYKNLDLSLNLSFKDLELDSLDKLEIILELEKEFNIELSNLENLLQLKTIEDIYFLVNHKLGA